MITQKGKIYVLDGGNPSELRSQSTSRSVFGKECLVGIYGRTDGSIVRTGYYYSGDWAPKISTIADKTITHVQSEKGLTVRVTANFPTDVDTKID